jgi:hypothetical protein
MNADLRKNLENLFLEPLTMLKIDNEIYKVSFDEKDGKLKVIKE